jgi:hypothetical protein
MSYILSTKMNCFPKVNRKKITIWCEECDLVFEDPSIADDHHEKKKHRIKKTEYLVMQDCYL